MLADLGPANQGVKAQALRNPDAHSDRCIGLRLGDFDDAWCRSLHFEPLFAQIYYAEWVLAYDWLALVNSVRLVPLQSRS